MGLVVFYLGGHHGAIYPDQMGYKDQIVALVERWRMPAPAES